MNEQHQFECPCCGAPMADRPPVSALKYLRIRGVTARAVTALAGIYPREISYRTLADLVYADDPNGGPDNAENAIASAISQSREKIARAGWRVGAASPGSKGVRLWPLVPAGERQ